MKPFYVQLKQCQIPDQVLTVLPEKEVEDIIVRCRFLRSLERPLAQRMVYAMWKTIAQLLDEYAPDVIIGTTPDNYVLDLFERVARSYGKPYIGMTDSFINGYSRFTNRGEIRIIRQPSEEEVESVYQRLLGKDYVPAFVKEIVDNSTTILLKRYLRDKIKPIAFWGLRLMTRDPLSFHYNTCRYKDKMMCKTLPHIFGYRYADKQWTMRLRNARGTSVVYVPLQFYPEVSTDYWCTSNDLIQVYDVLERLLEALEGEFMVCIKEHPAAVGYRSPQVYRNLTAHRNAVLVPFDVPSNAVIEQCDAVVTWGNTTGVEARIRGKPVVTLGTPYYDVEGCFAKVRTREDLDRLPDILNSAISANSTCDGKKMIQNILAGSFPGRFLPEFFSPSNAASVQETLNVIESIGKYIGGLLTEFAGMQSE